MKVIIVFVFFMLSNLAFAHNGLKGLKQFLKYYYQLILKKEVNQKIGLKITKKEWIQIKKKYSLTQLNFKESALMDSKKGAFLAVYDGKNVIFKDKKTEAVFKKMDVGSDSGILIYPLDKKIYLLKEVQ